MSLSEEIVTTLKSLKRQEEFDAFLRGFAFSCGIEHATTGKSKINVIRKITHWIKNNQGIAKDAYIDDPDGFFKTKRGKTVAFKLNKRGEMNLSGIEGEYLNAARKGQTFIENANNAIGGGSSNNKESKNENKQKKKSEKKENKQQNTRKPVAKIQPITCSHTGVPGSARNKPPVATIEGNEIKIKEGETIDEAAKRFFVAMPNAKREGFGEVAFFARRFKKLKDTSLSDEERMKLTPAIPTVIEKGDYIGCADTDKIRTDNIVKFHYFEANVLVKNEKTDKYETKYIGVTVGEDKQGRKFYNMVIDPDELFKKKQERERQ